MDCSSCLILGANGQLGRALQTQFPAARTADRSTLDITSEDSVKAYDWAGITHILNAAAYTDVEGAESPEGRVAAWQANAAAVSHLARIAREHDITLVHVSTDYVFDGSQNPHLEDEPFSPLGAYGASKAAGDIAAATAPKHYIIRSSWVVGDGKNFVRTILSIAKKGINPGVVADQIGRLTFTTEIARGIEHLLSHTCDYGTYNLTNGGDTVTWADITRQAYQDAGLPNTVSNTTTAEYFASKPTDGKRPLLSVMSLYKLHATGFESRDWRDDLLEYVHKEMQQ
jgi:dTDP-4-dehydrorhamnose reductase